MAFSCDICGGTTWDRRAVRGDGQGVVFCATCGMGVIEKRPTSTEQFYADGYYGGAAAEGLAPGSHYDDYSFTAEHTLLWARLLVEALRPNGGSIEVAAKRRRARMLRMTASPHSWRSAQSIGFRQ